MTFSAAIPPQTNVDLILQREAPDSCSSRWTDCQLMTPQLLWMASNPVSNFKSSSQKDKVLHPLFKEAEFNLWNIFMVMCFTVWFSTTFATFLSTTEISSTDSLWTVEIFLLLKAPFLPLFLSSLCVWVSDDFTLSPSEQTRWTIMHNYTILHTELLYTLSSITWEICAAFLTGKNWAAPEDRWRHGVGQSWRSCSVMLHWVSDQTHLAIICILKSGSKRSTLYHFMFKSMCFLPVDKAGLNWTLLWRKSKVSEKKWQKAFCSFI